MKKRNEKQEKQMQEYECQKNFFLEQLEKISFNIRLSSNLLDLVEKVMRINFWIVKGKFNEIGPSDKISKLRGALDLVLMNLKDLERYIRNV